MPNFNLEIEWNDEWFLKQFIIKECKSGKINRGIEPKRCQIIDYMSTTQLEKQLDFVGFQYDHPVNKAEKKCKLLEIVNGYEVETEEEQKDENHEENNYIITQENDDVMFDKASVKTKYTPKHMFQTEML